MIDELLIAADFADDQGDSVSAKLLRSFAEEIQCESNEHVAIRRHLIKVLAGNRKRFRRLGPTFVRCEKLAGILQEEHFANAANFLRIIVKQLQIVLNNPAAILLERRNVEVAHIVDVLETHPFFESNAEIRVDESLHQRSFVRDHPLAVARAEYYQLQFFDPTDHVVESSLRFVLQHDIAMKYHCLPIESFASSIVVAMNDYDTTKLEAISFATERTVRPAIATSKAISTGIVNLYFSDETHLLH